MIFKRLYANLRAQNWPAITIELAIVILGVFIGTWVANWNQERAEARETRDMLLWLRPELRSLDDFSSSSREYYAITGRYADTAFRGWSGDPSVSDAQFVIAAYQASQIYGFNNNGASWALAFGASDLRNIHDRAIREPLTRLITFDYTTLNFAFVQTPYRDEVRKYIPNDIQAGIRARCGDTIKADNRSFSLPPTCALKISPAEATAAAAALRRHPELVELLRQHRATIASYLINLGLFDRQQKLLQRQIESME